jgi:hypothetical protein
MDRIEPIERGLFLVRYRTADDLAPTHQHGLLELLTEAAERGPVAVAFDVPVAFVDASVPNFWLEVVRSQPNLVAIAVASPSMPVRLATEAFALAARARKAPLAVRSCCEVPEALSWASLQRRLATVAPAEVWRLQR